MSTTTSTSSLQRRRPRDDSSDAIRDALAGLQEDRDEADRVIQNETARRGELLRSGSEKQVRTGEDAINAARLQVERIDLMAQDLNAQLAQAGGRVGCSG